MPPRDERGQSFPEPLATGKYPAVGTGMSSPWGNEAQSSVGLSAPGFVSWNGVMGTGTLAVGADSPVESSQPCSSVRNHLSCVVSWGCNDSGREMKPQVHWVLPVQPDPAVPSRDKPQHRCGSPGPAWLPCAAFGGLFEMRLSTSLCPRCVGCLQQCPGACLGLRGACRGSVVAELQDGSCWAILGQNTEERGRSGCAGCWEVFVQGVKLRLEEEKPAGREEPKAGGGTGKRM